MSSPSWDESESDNDDEWFYNSIERYNQLHMYKLAFTPSFVDVSSDKILVAGCNKTNTSDMSIYAIPAKLIRPPNEEGLTKERDFSLIAGLTNELSEFVQVNFFDNEILTLQENGSLSLWKIKPQTDLIVKVCSLETSERPKSFSIITSNLLVLNYSRGFNLVNVKRGKEFKFEEEPRRSNVQIECAAKLKDDGKFITLEKNSWIRCHDYLPGDSFNSSCSPKDSIHNCGTDVNYVTTAVHVSGRSVFVVGFDKDNDMCFHLRKLRVPSPPQPKTEPFFRCIRCIYLFNLDILEELPVTGLTWSKKGCEKSMHNVPNLIVSTAKKIHVLRIPRDFFPNMMFEPLFCHDGHRGDVLQCVPHPSIKNLFFSSDAKNNLHAWSFLVKEPKTKKKH